MDQAEKTQVTQSRMAAVFTDIQFWIPVAVLICGLLILKLIR